MVWGEFSDGDRFARLYWLGVCGCAPTVSEFTRGIVIVFKFAPFLQRFGRVICSGASDLTGLHLVQHIQVHRFLSAEPATSSAKARSVSPPSWHTTLKLQRIRHKLQK